MSVKSREPGTAALAGLVVGGLVAAVLSIIDLPFTPEIGALVGGAVAGYLLYGRVSQAVVVGGVSGALSAPFFIGLVQILAIFEVIPIPSGPTPPLSELQAAVVAIVLMNLVAGGIGGSLVGFVRHPPKTMPPPPPPPGYAPTSARYCIQCGAQLQPGTVICPHCNARQPQSQ